MAVLGSKTRTPEEAVAAISATAVVYGVDSAKTAIVRILGRKRPFARVHIGYTDIDLGKVAQERNGHTVTAIHTSGDPQVVAAVGKAVATWLHACHGPRFTAEPAKPVLKPGTKTLFIAVEYPAAAG